MKFYMVPVEIANQIQEILNKFQQDHPEANEDDVQSIRSQLMDIYHEYNYIPEIKIDKVDPDSVNRPETG